MAPRSRIPLLAGLLIVAGVLAFANSFAAPFVYDDHSSITDNPNIRHLWPLATALSGPRQSALAGRPVVSLSMAINYALGGISPWGYHAWNLGVHLLAGLALFGIVRRTLRAPRLAARFGSRADVLAFACALVWIVHPLQTEVVDYVTQRTESMMGLCYLVTLYAAIRSMSVAQERRWRWYSVAIAVCALGMASKESMVSAPLLVLLYDAVFEAGTLRNALHRRAGLYLGLAATWIVLAALTVPGPRSHSAGFSSGVTPWIYFMNQPEMIATYLKLTFWPHGLVHDYGLPGDVAAREALPYALVVLVLLAATVVAWFKRQTELAFLGTWFFVTLAPASSVIPIATEVGAERRMYLPLAAIVTAVVLGGAVLFESLPRLTAPLRQAQGRPEPGRATKARGRIAVACLLFVYIALTALTLQRNAEYHSRSGIWETVLDRRPHGRAHYNLGLELKQEGRQAEATRQFQLALPDNPEGHYALGFELEAEGKYAEAIQHFREYVRLKPDDINVIRAYVLLGRSLQFQDRLEEAAEAFRQALRMQRGNTDARGALAVTLMHLERYEEAVAEYREYLRLVPGNAAAHSNLGMALTALDKDQEALQEFTTAVELNPDDPGVRLNLGNALAGVGRFEDAAAQYRLGLVKAPNDVALHNVLGTVLAAQGKVDEAVTVFRRSLALDPGNEQTRTDVEAVFPNGMPVRVAPKH